MLLNLNPRGMKRLMQLTANSVVGSHASGKSSVPVITYARASIFFSLNSKAQRCLTYVKCSSAVLEVHKQNVELSNSINIFHQNIRGLRSKLK
jgi:hypothetical protein